MKRAGIGSHTRPGQGERLDWLTPRWILDALGPFETDPCAMSPQPWPTAKLVYSVEGLRMPWYGRVWLNPPYDRHLGAWLRRLAEHRDGGTALLFARTETRTFVEWVWGRAAAILFLAGRPTFCRLDGTPGPGNSGGPVCLAAYGEPDAAVLERCQLRGAVVRNWRRAVP